MRETPAILVVLRHAHVVYLCLAGEFYGSSFATFESADDAAMAVACTGMKILGRPANIHFAEKRVKKQSVGAKSLQMRQMAPRPTGGTYKAFFGNLSYDIDVRFVQYSLSHLPAGVDSLVMGGLVIDLRRKR